MSDTNTQSAQGCMYHYTVKRGDSFYLIAQRTGVQLRDLLEANPDIPPARLMVGDVLCIPYCSAADTPAGDQCNPPSCENGGSQGGSQGGSGNTGDQGYVCPASRRAVVQDGQTAGDLQLRYNLSYHTLKTANAGRDLETLRGGDIICVPAENLACPVPGTVILGDNDTLESVATRYNVPIAQLLKENPCLAPQDFKPGASVRLPD